MPKKTLRDFNEGQVFDRAVQKPKPPPSKTLLESLLGTGKARKSAKDIKAKRRKEKEFIENL